MSKTTKKETAQQIDPMLREEAIATMNLARAIAGMGYNPYQGETIAAQSQGQQAARGMANQAAAAFGMQGGAGQDMPEADTTNSYGIAGYSPQKAMGAVPIDLKRMLEAFYKKAATETKYSPQPTTRGGKK